MHVLSPLWIILSFTLQGGEIGIGDHLLMLTRKKICQAE